MIESLLKEPCAGRKKSNKISRKLKILKRNISKYSLFGQLFINFGDLELLRSLTATTKHSK